MKCTKCGSLENQVNNTRTRLSTRGHNIDSKASSIPFTWRSRTCLSCGHKFSTREYTIPDLIAFGKQGYLKIIDDLTPN